MNRTEEYWNEVKKIAESVPCYDNLKDRTILVTGASGLICSAVCDLLFSLNAEKNMNMRLILAGRSKERIAGKYPFCTEGIDYTFVPFDATAPSLLSGVAFDLAIYGSSYGDPKAISDDPIGIIYSNVVGLDAVLKRASINKGKVLFVSSSEIYGRKDESTAYQEDDYGYIDILNPRASYPNSKRLGETLCAAYTQKYGIKAVIARPGHIYGPHITASDSKASAQFSRKAEKGEAIVLKSAGLQMRSYVYDLDCASAILTMLINGENNKAYNISNPDSVVTIRRLAEEFAAAGKVDLISEVPTESEAKSYNLMSRSDLKADKLLALGWKPQYDITRGAAATLKYL